MGKQTIQNLSVPAEIKQTKIHAQSELELRERALIRFFSDHYHLFTPYENYFRTRGLEFMAMRQLLPDYFDIEKPYQSVLEIGCGFGYRSLFLAPFSGALHGIDIPEKYESHTTEEFKTSVDVAKVLIGERFGILNITFDTAWPHQIPAKDASCDLIYSEYVLEHIPHLIPALTEMYRVLTPGGVMIHTVPSTQDAVLAFVQANSSQIDQQKRSLLHKVRARLPFGGTVRGVVVPPNHSEFVHDFPTQLEVFSLDNFLFPLLELGARVEKIITTREYNRVIVVRRPYD